MANDGVGSNADGWSDAADADELPALAAIAKALPDAVLVIDSTACVRWANRAAERLFGVSLDEAIGANGLDFIHPDDFQLAALALTSVQDKDVGSLLELRVRSGDTLATGRDDRFTVGRQRRAQRPRPHRAAAMGSRRRRGRAVPFADAERGVGDVAPDARRHRRVVVGRSDADARARSGMARATTARRGDRRSRSRRATRRAA